MINFYYALYLVHVDGCRYPREQRGNGILTNINQKKQIPDGN
jgi:hypothetical protein